MNKRSFFCGVLIGILVTWTFAFYLYYILNSNSAELAKLQKNIFNFDSDEDSKEDSKEEVKIIDDDLEVVHSKLKVKKKYDRKLHDPLNKKNKPSMNLMNHLQPVTIKQSPEFGQIRSLEDQVIRDNGYKTHAFNVFVSNQIGLIREIPDTRHNV